MRLSRVPPFASGSSNGALRTTGKAARDILKACFEIDRTLVGMWPESTYLDGDKRKAE